MLKSSVSPHIHSAESIERSMGSVNLALLPALLASVYFFGPRALLVVCAGVLSSVGFEILMQKLMKKPVTVSDGSAVITGVLLAFNMPPNIPLYVPVVGSAFGIIVVKHLFGGLGNNIFNPALAGRVFVMFAWLPEMTSWNVPLDPGWLARTGLFSFRIDSITAATPLAINKLQGFEALVQQFGGRLALYKQCFLGNTAGCIGETSELALLIGFIFLMARRVVVMPLVPFLYILTVFLFSGLLGQDGLFHILSGGLFLGALFMATDYVTTPLTIRGSLLYGTGLGVLTVLLRLKSGLPEGVSFSILLMNALTPLIDKYINVRPYGKKALRGK